jgi:large subunit ribosomal protein L24
MKIKKGDKVQVITGKDNGKTGTVLKVFPSKNRVLVEGVNIVKRSVKPGTVSKEGGIVKVERPISLSNVMFFDEKAGRPVRIGKKIIDDKKYRVSKSTDEVIDKKL